LRKEILVVTPENSEYEEKTANKALIPCFHVLFLS